MTGRKRPALEVVQGGTAEPPRRAPATALTKAQRAEVKRGLERTEAAVDALLLLEAAYTAVNPRMAYDQAHARAVELGDDVDHLRPVLTVLAVEAVWMLPASTVERPRTDVEIFTRQTQLATWMWRRRLAVMKRIRDGRSLLRRRQ